MPPSLSAYSGSVIQPRSCWSSHSIPIELPASSSATAR